MGKKSSAPAISNVSSTSSPMNGTGSANRTSILKSSFAPSRFQLHLFASVIQSFDAQQLRIHDANTGRLRQQHPARPGSTITSLDWGCYGQHFRDNHGTNKHKKRKRSGYAAEDVVVAYGTSTSVIYMYSPTLGQITGELSGGHTKAIEAFKFASHNNTQAWSIGADNRLVQWDLNNDRAMRTVDLPDSSIHTLAFPSSVEPVVLCASTRPYTIDLSSFDDFRVESFDSFKHDVHSIFRADPGNPDVEDFFLAADGGRAIQVFSMRQKRVIKTLLASSEVHGLAISSADTTEDRTSQDQILAAVCNNGTAELFSRPFLQTTQTHSDLKSKRKSMTSKARAVVRLLSSDSKTPISIYAASFQGPNLVLVSVSGGVDPTFQNIRWQDEGTGDMLFEGVREINMSKSASILNVATMNGVKDMGKNHVDESRSVVANGDADNSIVDEAIAISSEEADSEDSEAENEKQINAGTSREESPNQAQNNDTDVDAEMEDAEANSEADVANVKADENRDLEPSFGDLLAARHPETIAVADAFATEKSAFAAVDSQPIPLPAGMSLGTVLTQALRTNDLNLLESCLHANDTGIIQNTIQRLDSSLAAILLSTLAERLASRPGRYGHLMSWVQWTCIAHGGAIAGQPHVATRIRTLYTVLTARSKSLDKLLLLKGKLDLLDAQLTLRKQLQAQRGSAGRDDEDEPGMIYVEGGDDNWSSDEDDHDEALGSQPKRLGFKTRVPLPKNLNGLVDHNDDDDDDDNEGDSEDLDSEDDNQMALVNGTASARLTDDEEGNSDSEIDTDGRRRQPQGIIDDEAEVSGESEEEEEDDNSDEGDDAESEEEEDDDDDDEDSSMNDFINDGEISVASDDILDDAAESSEEERQKPATKKSRRK